MASTTTTPFTKIPNAFGSAEGTKLELQVILMHKPRGSGGSWQEVTPGSAIRVTKGQGKKMKLLVICSKAINPASVHLSIIDVSMTTPIKHTIGFQVEKVQLSLDPRMMEIELLLLEHFKKMVFEVTLNSVEDQQIAAHSVDIISHNNGKALKPTGFSVNGSPQTQQIANQQISAQQSTIPMSQTSQMGQPQSLSPPSFHATSPQRMITTPSPTYNQPYSQSVIQSISSAQTPPPQDISPISQMSSPAENELDDLLNSLIVPEEQQNRTEPTSSPTLISPTLISTSPSMPPQNSNAMSTNKKRRIEEAELFVNSPAATIPGDLEVRGVIRAHQFLQFSDMNLKTNIEEIADALDIVQKLQGKQYEWRDDQMMSNDLTPGEKVIGFIAQEVS